MLLLMRGKLQMLDKAVDRLGYWIGGWSIVSGAFTAIWSQVGVLHSLEWAEILLLGIASGSLLLLILSACLVSWRFFRLSPSAVPNDGSSEHRFLEIDKDPEGVDGVAVQIEGINQSLADLSERVRGACQSAQSSIDYSKGTRDALMDSFRDVRTHFDDVMLSSEKFKSRVFNLLLAKQRLENVVTLALDIIYAGKYLGEIKDIRPVDQDEEFWRASFERWKSSILNYESLARDIDPTLPPESKTNAEDYRDDRWSNERPNFSSDLLRHDYKEYRLIYLQFEALHQMVLEKLRLDSSI